jgi:hypothetical protein
MMRVKLVIISSAAGRKVSAVSVSRVWIDRCRSGCRRARRAGQHRQPAGLCPGSQGATIASRSTQGRCLTAFILALGDLFQPLRKMPLAIAGRFEVAFRQRVQGPDLAWHEADDDPGVADLDEHDTLAGANHQTANDAQGTAAAESATPIELAQQVRSKKQNADDQDQSQNGLQQHAC